MVGVAEVRWRESGQTQQVVWRDTSEVGDGFSWGDWVVKDDFWSPLLHK